MRLELTEMVCSTAIEVTVGERFRPAKVRAFTSRSFKVSDPPAGASGPQEIAMATNNELSDQYQVLWNQMKVQAKVDQPSEPPKAERVEEEENGS